MFSEVQRCRCFSTFSKNILLNIFIYTENDTGSHKNMKNNIFQYKTPKTPKVTFNNPFFVFPKYISVGLPGSLWIAFELKKKAHKKIRPVRLH